MRTTTRAPFAVLSSAAVSSAAVSLAARSSAAGIALVALIAASMAFIPTLPAGAAAAEIVFGCDYSLSAVRTVRVDSDASMRKAIDDRRPGDLILINTNNTLGPLHVMEGKGGYDGKWITIAAAKGTSPKIASKAWAAVDIREPYVQVCGLELVGTATETNWQDVTRVGVSAEATHHVRVVGNHIHNFSLAGITLNHSNNLEVLNNNVHHNSYWGPEQGSGISIYQPNDAIGNNDPKVAPYQITISGNKVHHNANKVTSTWYRNKAGHLVATDGNGIILDDFETLQKPKNQRNPFDGNTLVANNVVYRNGGRGIHAGPNGGRHIHILNNTAYHNLTSVGDDSVRYDEFGRAEITIFGTQGQSSWDIKLINNIMVVDPNLNPEMDEVRAFYRGNIADWSIEEHHNSFVGEATKGFFNFPGQKNSQDDHELGNRSDQNAMPPFRDAAKYDLRLTRKWRKGSAVATPLISSIDHDGDVRPRGKRQERGAYEFRR